MHRVVWLLLFALVGCRHVTLDRARVDRIKRVAVVQYALNPYPPAAFGLGGAAAAIDSATGGQAAWESVVARRLDRFAAQMGRRWQVVPPRELAANPAVCSGGHHEVTVWRTAGGMCLFDTDDEGLTQALLSSGHVKQLQEALGVDGVIAISEVYELWNTRGGSTYRKRFRINLYDAANEPAWSDAVYGKGNSFMGSGGDGEEYFVSALELWQEHLSE